MKKKGFTLIELLAVIVILGVIMIIAIPSVTSYITNARKDSYISDATMFVNAAKTKLTADAILPQGNGEQYIVSIKDIDLDKGGEKSPYGNDWDYDRSYILVENIGTSSDPEYVWKVALNDVKNNCISLTDMTELKRAVVGTNCQIIVKHTGAFNPALNPNGTIPAGATYYSGVTSFDDTTFEVVATNTYTEGDNFPTVKDADIYVYGDYVYEYDNGSRPTDWGGTAWDSGHNGWTVYTKDKTQSSYGEILESINDKFIENMNYTFEDCTNLIKGPNIPGGVIYMNGTFSKSSIVIAPDIPSSVKKMIGTFQLCESLVNPPEIPEGVETMAYTFNFCSKLTGNIVINANPSNVAHAFSYTQLPIKIIGSATAETKANLAATASAGNVTY